MGNPKAVTKKQLLKVIDELQNSPNDRGRILGDVGITTVGVGLGAAGAATIATVAGATTIPALTTAASWIGITAVAATPLGWFVGAAIGGGALSYGVSRLRKRRISTKNSERFFCHGI